MPIQSCEKKSPVFYFWLLILLFITNTAVAKTLDSSCFQKTGNISVLDFDHFPDLIKNEIKINASALVKGKFNNALFIDHKQNFRLCPPHPLSADEGAIAFWLCPLWPNETDTSQTFFTFRWEHPKNSYFALSWGWWEPDFKKRLVFVLSNQEQMHCMASPPFRFETGFWYYIAVTWQKGKNGYCRMYVDGQQVAASEKPFIGGYQSKERIFLGSDEGATNKRGRSAKMLFDELKIYDMALSAQTVKRLYQTAETDQDSVEAKKWKWLQEGLAIEKIESRSEKGELNEPRVIFDEGIFWAISQKETDKRLQKIKQAGFNVYVPCVWHGRKTYYPSPLGILDERLKKRVHDNDDPLQYLITSAHRLGIEVHPWFTVVRRETDKMKAYYEEGVPDNAFNVHNPEFRNFIIALITDVVRRYEVDGINLDYIRTMGICTSEVCQENYFTTTGGCLGHDLPYKKINSANRDRIQDWQDTAVDSIVQRLSENIKKINPDIVLSVDAHPIPFGETRPLQGCNSLKWLQNGWIDIVFNMDYRQQIDVKKMDRIRRQISDQRKIIQLFGNYDIIDGKAMPRKGQIIANYAAFAQRKWPQSGLAFYMYKMLSEDQIQALRNGPFNEDASPYWPKRQ
ncbi:MAG: family 10 glycosylhydrolase [Thermodesulfobacteriota bacterium]|nr:family 10 glycosylhydrolase [Thermodesulfobacteriota bacterium]